MNIILASTSLVVLIHIANPAAVKGQGKKEK
jgi:hypothetical protein